MTKSSLPSRLALLGLCLGLGAAALPAQAKDYLVTVSRPNNLYMVDLDDNRIVSNCTLPDHFGPGTVVMSPDNKIAYVLNHHWENVYGVEVDTCKVVFQAKQSSATERVKSLASLAVSPDGKELYTVQNPVRLEKDRYQALAPRFAVFDTAAGLDAKPIRTFPASRRVTVMAAGDNGLVYMAGADIEQIDPKTGKRSVAIPNANWKRPGHGAPDVLAMWPIGKQSNEFMLMYTAPKFKPGSKDPATADLVWGYSRVDLKTGQKEVRDFAPFEVIMFSGMTRPQRPDLLYGVYTQLSQHDVKSGKLVKRIDLDHTYYCINMSSDGKKVYLAGTNSDIAIYDSDTLAPLGKIQLPEKGDMSTSTMQIFSRN